MNRRNAARGRLARGLRGATTSRNLHGRLTLNTRTGVFSSSHRRVFFDRNVSPERGWGACLPPEASSPHYVEAGTNVPGSQAEAGRPRALARLPTGSPLVTG